MAPDGRSFYGKLTGMTWISGPARTTRWPGRLMADNVSGPSVSVVRPSSRLVEAKE